MTTDSNELETVNQVLDTRPTASEMRDRNRFATSIDTSDRKGALAAFAAMGDPVAISESDKDIVLELAHYIVRDMQVADIQTGELTTRTAVYLIDAKGQAYITVSSGIAQRLADLASLFPEWLDEPVKIKLTQKKLDKGRTVRTFNVID